MIYQRARARLRTHDRDFITFQCAFASGLWSCRKHRFAANGNGQRDKCKIIVFLLFTKNTDFKFSEGVALRLCQIVEYQLVEIVVSDSSHMRNILLSHLTAKFRTGVSFGRWRAISRRLSRDDMRKQKWQEYPLSSPWLRVLTRPLFFSCFSWKGEILVKSPTTPPKKGAWAAKVCQSYMRASHNQKSNGSPFLSLSRRNRKDKWREKKKEFFTKLSHPVTLNICSPSHSMRIWYFS